MGQKVNPVGLRLGVIKDWQARWYSGQGYAKNLLQDLKVRDYIQGKLSNAAVSKITIERARQEIVATVHTARPGIVIGKKGEDIEKMRRELSAMMGHRVDVKITEIRKPEVDANLVAESIAQQLEKRVMFRKAMRRAVQNAMRLGAKGIKVMVAGRLNGAEIARTEWYREGRVPLHTLRADIDYGQGIARTTYGVIGVKVWIFHGEVFGREAAGASEAA
jgi:small subunit ribosomal protein S3